jgi:hypothetical protein
LSLGLLVQARFLGHAAQRDKNLALPVFVLYAENGSSPQFIEISWNIASGIEVRTTEMGIKRSMPKSRIPIKWSIHPRLFVSILVTALTAALLPAWLHLSTRILCIWDAGMICFLSLTWAVMFRSTPAMMSHKAKLQDEGRLVILSLITATACASLLAIGFIIHETKNVSGSALYQNLMSVNHINPCKTGITGIWFSAALARIGISAIFSLWADSLSSYMSYEHNKFIKLIRHYTLLLFVLLNMPYLLAIVAAMRSYRGTCYTIFHRVCTK